MLENALGTGSSAASPRSPPDVVALDARRDSAGVDEPDRLNLSIAGVSLRVFDFPLPIRVAEFFGTIRVTDVVLQQGPRQGSVAARVVQQTATDMQELCGRNAGA